MLKHLVLFGCLGLGACSAASGSGSRLDGSAAAASGATAAGTGATGATGATDNNGGSLQLDPNVGGGGSSGAEMGCASESQEAHAIPTDLLVLLDQSGSMTIEGDRWDPTTKALKAFVSNPA